MIAVPKDQARDRMVLDARAPNKLEKSERRWIRSLGSVSQFHHFFVTEGEQLRLYAEDLREYYHAFLISPHRILRNAYLMKIERSDAKHLKAYTPDLAGYERLVPCLRTLAMGDTNAVAYGQAAHLGVLLQKTSLRLRDFVTLKQRPDLKKRWMAGLMIDDFVLLEAFKKDSDSEVRCKQIIEEVHRAYDEVKLPRHTGKSVCGETRGSFWGVELNGEECRFRPVLARAIPLAQLILEVVDLGQASVGLLEVIAGCLVSIFQLRRRFMSALQEIYGSQRGRDRKEVVQLSQELKEEMIKCVPLIMLTNLDMKMRGAPLPVASDASSRYEAAVAADVGEEATEVLQQLGLQKGLWSKLLRPVQAFEREKGGAMGVGEPELPGEQYTCMARDLQRSSISSLGPCEEGQGEETH